MTSWYTFNAGELHKALTKAIAIEGTPPTLLVPSPGEGQRQLARVMSQDDTVYWPVLARWITTLLLRCDNVEYHAWQAKYMSLDNKQHVAQDPQAAPA